MDLGTLSNWGGADNPGAISISLSNGDSINTTVASYLMFTSTPLTFIGIQSDTPFSSVVFTDPSQSLMIDNFAFSSSPPSVVPEPSTLTLLGIGAVGLVGYRWRRRRHSA